MLTCVVPLHTYDKMQFKALLCQRMPIWPFMPRTKLQDQTLTLADTITNCHGKQAMQGSCRAGVGVAQRSLQC